MEKGKVYAIGAAAVVLVATIGAAYVLTNRGAKEAPETNVTDALGRTVSIPEQMDSIFCVGACSLRLVSYFDAVKKVQAIETHGTFNTRDDQTYYLINKARFSALPQVAETAEAILELNPSLIITSKAQDAGVADTLQAQTNIPVYVINADLEFGEAFHDQIVSLGTLFGEKDRAAELNEGIAGMISEIKSRAPSAGTESAYACGMFFYGGASFLKGSGDYLPFDYSNVPNAIPPAANGQPYVITLETLINADPDHIFIDGIGLSGVISSIKEYIEAKTGLGDASAVKNNRVYSTMIYKCYGTNWENQLVNAYYVASVVNGELYSWEFEDKASEVIKLFYPETTMTYSDIAQGQTSNGCSKVSFG